MATQLNQPTAAVVCRLLLGRRDFNVMARNGLMCLYGPVAFWIVRRLVRSHPDVISQMMKHPTIRANGTGLRCKAYLTVLVEMGASVEVISIDFR